MDKSGWPQLFMAIVIAWIGFYHAFKVKPGDYRRGSVQFILMKYARDAGWIAAIGGSLGAIRVLVMMLIQK